MSEQPESALVTDNRIGPNFGRAMIHRECSAERSDLRRQLAAAHAARAADRQSAADHSGLRPGEIGDIEFFHTRNRRGNCAIDRFEWPCPTWRAAMEVKRLRALLAPPAAEGGAGNGRPKCCLNWAYDPEMHGDWDMSARHHPACEHYEAPSQQQPGDAAEPER